MNARPTMLIVLILLVFSINVSQVRSQQSLYVTVHADRAQYMELASITGNVTYQGELVHDGLVGIQVENHPSNTPSQPTTVVMRTLPLNPSQSFPFSLEIVSLVPVDGNGNPKLGADRGTYMWVNMTFKNKCLLTRKVCASVTLLDHALIPLTVEMATFTMPGGATDKFMPRIYIPRWAKVGTAYIYGNAYGSWPKDGGFPLCAEKVSSVDIEGSSSMSSSQPAQNGTYEMNFRLRPDMAWGMCQVDTSAWSPWAEGYTGSSSTDFEYWLPGDFDKDLDVDLYDAVALLRRYGSKEGNPLYDEIYDIAAPPAPSHADGHIGLYDAVLTLRNYGVKPQPE